MRHFILACLCCAVIALASCASKPPAPAPSGGGKTVDPATAAAIAGRVTFVGKPPTAEAIRMNADPACLQVAGTSRTSDTVLVSPDGSLQNVFVYVKDAFSEYTFETPATPVVLDQRGCRYAPHVFGVRVGQPVEFLNSDATLHNVHAMPMKNQEFNRGEAAQGMRIRQAFTVPEVMVPIKCNVHGWMNAYVGVMANPYFAVTGADGTFSLKGLPPGTYAVEAWHEKYGTQTQQVTVGEKQTQTIAFSFSAK